MIKKKNYILTYLKAYIELYECWFIFVNFQRTALGVWVAKVAIDADADSLMSGSIAKRMQATLLLLTRILASMGDFITVSVVGAIVVMSAFNHN